MTGTEGRDVPLSEGSELSPTSGVVSVTETVAGCSESPATLPRRQRPEGNLRVGRLPEGCVYVGRQSFWLRRSPYANPHTTSENGCRECGGQVHTRAEAVEAYREHLRGQPDLVERARRELAGKPLACWCPLPGPGEPDVCHADLLIRVVAGEEP